MVHVVVPEPPAPPGEEEIRVPRQDFQVPGELRQVVQLVDRIGIGHALDVDALDVACRTDGARADEVANDSCRVPLRVQPALVSLAAGELDAQAALAGRRRGRQERLGRGDAGEDLVAAEVGPLVVELRRLSDLDVVEDRREVLEVHVWNPGQAVERRERRCPDDVVAGDVLVVGADPGDAGGAGLNGGDRPAEHDATAHPLHALGEQLREAAHALRRVQEHRLDRFGQQRVLEQAPQGIGLGALVDDGAVDTGPGPVAVQIRRRMEQKLVRVRLEEDVVERAAVLVDDVRLERLAGQVLLEQQIARAAEHQRERHREQDAGTERPLVKTPEHPRAAPARDLDRLAAEDAADEAGDPPILGVEPVRADVEVEVAVVKRPGEAADDRVLLDHGDVKALSDELIRNGQAGHAGADNRH